MAETTTKAAHTAGRDLRAKAIRLLRQHGFQDVPALIEHGLDVGLVIGASKYDQKFARDFLDFLTDGIDNRASAIRFFKEKGDHDRLVSILFDGTENAGVFRAEEATARLILAAAAEARNG